MKMNEMGEFYVDERAFSYAAKPLDVKARMLESFIRAGRLRRCDVCGAVFHPYAARNVYCSFGCRQEANRYRARQRKRRERKETA